MHNLIPLHLLARGQSAEIGRLVGEADQVHRMEELGLRTGVVVEMLQPGSPCIIRIERSQKFCFRRCDTFGILVRLGNGNGAA